ncbi:PREDICTED: period circadian protein homolog 1-like [Branchiostoma belcheri]|uniref:Period circadian protein homolog 1-like n=1 Tax=Branchiostoma belcheri TaxID=7741 RepID=A0A6P4Z6U8_BRABE|nr:PREDICTED: period circadian protein homolog 1-like [Branchiostoma belcheri]
MACNQEEPMSEGGTSQTPDTDPEQTVSLDQALAPAITAPVSSPASSPSDNGKDLGGCSVKGNASTSSSGATHKKETVDYFLKKPASPTHGPTHGPTPSTSGQATKQKDKYWDSKSANGSSNGNGSNGEHSDDMAVSVTGSTNGSSNSKSGSGTEQPMEVENSENGEQGSNLLSNYGSSENSDSKSATLSMLSGSSNDDQPSTSGCSSEQSVKAKNREKLVAAIQELKSMLPPSTLNDGNEGKPSTLAALTHAIECVKKVSSSNAFDLPFPEEEEDPSTKDNSIPTYSLHSLCTLSKNVVLQNMVSVGWGCTIIITVHLLVVKAVPLTGYLPQDLIGRCIFDFINQDDAPIMLSVHEKVVKTPMGQTFNEGPIRLLVRNGNEVTIETSWSSFINPWTRKIDFVIGQHRVTRGPQEIDVFRNPIKAWIGHTEIRKDITAMEQAICKLLLQTTIPQLATPDHHLVSPVENPDQFAEDVDVQEKCMDMHILKARGQQIFAEKVKKMADKPGKEAEDAKGTSSSSNVYSPSQPAALPNYEQLNYAQNIHRYLLSCPDVFSNSSMEEDQQQEQDLTTAMDAVQAAELPRGAEASNLLPDEGLPSQTGVITTIETSTRPVAVTTGSTVMTMAPMSQDSHVPLDPAHSEDIPIVDDFSDKNETNSEVGEPLPPASSYQKVGLTQEILSQHTINQERTYVEQALKEGYNHLLLPHFQRRHGHKRQLLTPENETVTNKLSKHCQISNGIPRHRTSMSNSSSIAPQTTLVDAQTAQNMFVPIHNPSQNQSMPMGQMQVPVFPNQMGMNLSMFGMPFGMPVPQFMQGGMPPTGQPMMGSVPMMPMAQNFMYSGFFPHYGFSSAGGFTVPTTPSMQIPQGSSIWTQVPQRPLFHQGGGMQPLHINTDPGTLSPTVQMEAPLSHVSAQCLNPTPVVAACSTSADPTTTSVPPPAPTTGISERVGSQCSSPLQLNLMQQELQEGGSRQTAAQAGSTCHQSPHRKLQTDQEGLAPVKKVCKTAQVKDKEDDNSLDTSSMLDLLLAESNDGNSSTPDLGSDPSFTSSEGSNTQEQKRKMESRERENFKRYVLQDPIWRVMANTTQKVMMTYQLPRREIDDVLKQDQDKLRSMERNQPAFSAEQMGELEDVKLCWGKMKMPDIAACDEAIDKCLSKKRKRMPSRKHLSVQTVISPTMESVLESNLPSSSGSSQKSETEMANLPGDIGRSTAKDSDNWGDNSNVSNGRSSRSSSSIKESDDKSQSNNSKDSDEYPVEKRLPPKRHSSPTTSNSSSDL